MGLLYNTNRETEEKKSYLKSVGSNIISSGASGLSVIGTGLKFKGQTLQKEEGFKPLGVPKEESGQDPYSKSVGVARKTIGKALEPLGAMLEEGYGNIAEKYAKNVDQDYSTFRDETGKISPKKLTNPKTILQTVTGVLGQMSPVLGAAAVSPNKVQTLVGGMALMEKGDAVEAFSSDLARTTGTDPKDFTNEQMRDIDAKSDLYAVAAGVLESIAPTRLFTVSKNVAKQTTKEIIKQAPKEIITNMILEGGTEGVQRFSQNLISKLSEFDPEKDVFEEVADEFWAGFYTGGAFGLGSVVKNLSVQYKMDTQIKTSQENAQKITEAIEIAQKESFEGTKKQYEGVDIMKDGKLDPKLVDGRIQDMKLKLQEALGEQNGSDLISIYESEMKGQDFKSFEQLTKKSKEITSKIESKIKITDTKAPSNIEMKMPERVTPEQKKKAGETLREVVKQRPELESVIMSAISGQLDPGAVSSLPKIEKQLLSTALEGIRNTSDSVTVVENINNNLAYLKDFAETEVTEQNLGVAKKQRETAEQAGDTERVSALDKRLSEFVEQANANVLIKDPEVKAITMNDGTISVAMKIAGKDTQIETGLNTPEEATKKAIEMAKTQTLSESALKEIEALEKSLVKKSKPVKEKVTPPKKVEETKPAPKKAKPVEKKAPKKAVKKTKPTSKKKVSKTAKPKEVKANQATPGQSRIQEARKYKTADEFVKAQGDIKVDDYLEKKFNGKVLEYDSTTGSGLKQKGIKIGDNIVRYQIFDQNGQIWMPKIFIDKKGTGLGTEFINSLKELADLKGKNLVISSVENPKFFDKFKWLKNEGGAYRYETKSQLTNIWNKANKGKPTKAKSTKPKKPVDHWEKKTKYYDPNKPFEVGKNDPALDPSIYIDGKSIDSFMVNKEGNIIDSSKKRIKRKIKSEKEIQKIVDRILDKNVNRSIKPILFIDIVNQLSNLDDTTIRGVARKQLNMITLSREIRNDKDVETVLLHEIIHIAAKLFSARDQKEVLGFYLKHVKDNKKMRAKIFGSEANFQWYLEHSKGDQSYMAEEALAFSLEADIFLNNNTVLEARTFLDKIKDFIKKLLNVIGVSENGMPEADKKYLKQLLRDIFNKDSKRFSGIRTDLPKLRIKQYRAMSLTRLELAKAVSRGEISYSKKENSKVLKEGTEARNFLRKTQHLVSNMERLMETNTGLFNAKVAKAEAKFNKNYSEKSITEKKQLAKDYDQSQKANKFVGEQGRLKVAKLWQETYKKLYKDAPVKTIEQMFGENNVELAKAGATFSFTQGKLTGRQAQQAKNLDKVEALREAVKEKVALMKAGQQEQMKRIRSRNSEELKLKKDILRKALNKKILNLKEAQALATDFVYANTPSNATYAKKFLKALKAKNMKVTPAKQQEQIKDIIRRVEKERVAYEKKRLEEDIKKLQDRAIKYLKVDHQNVIVTAMSNLGLKNATRKMEKAIGKTQRYLEAHTDEKRLVRETLKEIGLDKPVNTESLASEDLVRINNVFKSYYKKARWEKKAGEVLARYTREQNIKALQSGSKSLQILPEGNFSKYARDNFKLQDKAKDKLRAFDLNFLTMDRIFNILDGKKNYTGINYTTFKKPVDAGNIVKVNMEGGIAEQFASLKHDLKMTTENEYRIAVFAIQAQGMTDRLLQLDDVAETVDGERVLKKEFRDIKLTEAEQNIYTFMREIIDQFYPQVAKTAKESRDVALDYLENFFPIMYENTGSFTDEMERMHKTGDKVPYRPLKQRVDKVSKDARIRLDTFGVFSRYVTDSANFVAYDKLTTDLKKIAKTDSYKQAVGTRAQKVILDWLDLIQRNGRPTTPDGILMRTSQNIGVYILGFRVSTILKQPLALLDGASEVGYRVFTHAPEAMTDKWQGFIAENSVEYRNRSGGDMAYAIEKAEKWIGKTKQASFLALKLVDRYTAASVWLGAYNKYCEENGIKVDVNNFNAEAGAYADRVMRQTQATAEVKDLPPMYNNEYRQWAHSGLKFQNFMLTARWGALRHDLSQDWKVNKPKAIAKMMFISASIFIEHGINIGLYNAFLGITGGDDDERQEFFKSMWTLPFDQVPIVGMVTNAIDYKASPVPLVNIGQKGFDSMNYMFTGATRETKIKHGINSIAIALGISLGLPLDELRKFTTSKL